MEFGLREWMILIGGLLILAVVADGVRRVLADRRKVIRMGMSHQNEPSVGEYVNPELPYGGARSVPRSEFDSKASRAPAFTGEVAVAPPGKVVKRPVDQPQPRQQPAKSITPAVEPDAVPDKFEDVPDEPGATLELPPEPDFDFEPDPAIYAEPSSDYELELPLGAGADFDFEQATADVDTRPIFEPEPEPEPEPKPEPARKERAATLNAQPDEVLIINVLSRDKNGFNGADLLEVLLACDVRFGEMDIFHRFEGTQGQGQIQFSVANLVKPGTFDLSAIKEFYTPGVCMFLQLPGPERPLEAFDCMAEIATCIVKNLQGDMRDENHSVLTAQTMEHYRQRIREYERKRLMRAAHRSA
jgi:cell division protein ZipA